MRCRLVGSVAIVFAIVTRIAGSRPLTAQVATQPSLTVAAFDADRSSGFSPDDRRAMADELAQRFVETGRFRVLEREWLPVPTDAREPLEIGTLRAAASSAGVEYIVQGTVRRASAAGSRVMPLIPVRSGPVLIGPLRPGRAGSSGARESFISVSVRVIEAASGAVVRSSVARAGESAPRLAPAVIIPSLLLRGPAGAMGAMAAVNASGSRLNGGVQHALADIAHTLNLSATPAMGAR